MRYLGIDYGTKRVGVAISDETNSFALPKVVLPADSNLLENLQKIFLENNITTVVIGESKNYKMEENAIMGEVFSLKKKIEDECGLPVFLEPEFLTSAEAERLQGKNKMLDASSAAIILKSYLDKIKNKNQE